MKKNNNREETKVSIHHIHSAAEVYVSIRTIFRTI